MNTSDIRNYSNALKDLSVSSELNKLLESQGSVPQTYKKINELTAAKDVLNKEFDERYASTGGQYKLPLFGTNQDILLLGFFFSYTFLTIVVLISLYKNTGSIQNTIYGFFISAFSLLIIVGLLFRIG